MVFHESGLAEPSHLGSIAAEKDRLPIGATPPAAPAGTARASADTGSRGSAQRLGSAGAGMGATSCSSMSSWVGGRSVSEY
jgi:hypothetical protein